MSTGLKLFTCPKCLHSYLGHDPLPDCPRCGFDYRERQGFRWDVVVYLLTILGLVSFLLVSSYYRGLLGLAPPPAGPGVRQQAFEEQLLGADRRTEFDALRTPSLDPGR